jgi:hypothetical protein
MIDGQPALDLYKNNIGRQSKGTQASLLYPLNVTPKENRPCCTYYIKHQQ